MDYTKKNIGIIIAVIIVFVIIIFIYNRYNKRKTLVDGFFKAATANNPTGTIQNISDAEKLKKIPYKDIKTLYKFFFEYISKGKKGSDIPEDIADEVLRIYQENNISNFKSSIKY